MIRTKHLLLLAGLAGTLFFAASCKKEQVKSPVAKSTSRTVSTDEISMAGDIPRYASPEVYQAAYEQLSLSYNEHLAGMESRYVAEEDLSGEEYEAMAWELWEESKLPLANFEAEVGISASMRSEYDNSYRDWLKEQEEIMDEESAPVLMVDPVQAAMANKYGEYIIGEDAYVILQLPEGAEVVQFLGEENRDLLEPFRALAKGTRKSLMDQLQDWRNSKVVFFNFTTSPPGPTDCRNGLVYQKWINVDDNTKYLMQHSYYYDLLKTSAVFNLEAAARINLVIKKRHGYQFTR